MSTTEPYETLDARYRPRDFGELVGQHMAVDKVEGMLQKGIVRTVLIHGAYGSGKTTLSRLIAQYANCETYGPSDSCFSKRIDHDHQPALCSSCRFFDGPDPSHPDYQEMNCGDTRGIDDIRDLIGTASLSPRYRYRVICLDEAQELTKNALSALLKPLEEPSPQTIWILATTAKDKIPPTMRSRCLDVRVQLVSDKDMSALVHRVSSQESLGFSDEVQRRVVEVASGHPRIALKVLEGLRSVVDKDVSVEDLYALVGGNSEASVRDFVVSLLNGKPSTLRKLDAVSDADAFLSATIQMLRSIALTMGGSSRSPCGDAIFDAVPNIGLTGRSGQKFASVLNLMVTAQAQSRGGNGVDPLVILEVATMQSLAVMTCEGSEPK